MSDKIEEDTSKSEDTMFSYYLKTKPLAKGLYIDTGFKNDHQLTQYMGELVEDLNCIAVGVPGYYLNSLAQSLNIMLIILVLSLAGRIIYIYNSFHSVSTIIILIVLDLLFCFLVFYVGYFIESYIYLKCPKNTISGTLNVVSYLKKHEEQIREDIEFMGYQYSNNITLTVEKEERLVFKQGKNRRVIERKMNTTGNIRVFEVTDKKNMVPVKIGFFFQFENMENNRFNFSPFESEINSSIENSTNYIKNRDQTKEITKNEKEDFPIHDPQQINLNENKRHCLKEKDIQQDESEEEKEEFDKNMEPNQGSSISIEDNMDEISSFSSS